LFARVLRGRSIRALTRRAASACHGLEPLELRTLLSVAVAANGKTATYTDLDGDKVTIAVSAGTLTAGNFTSVNSGLGEQLRAIDLSGGGFDGANLSVTVQKVSTA